MMSRCLEDSCPFMTSGFLIGDKVICHRWQLTSTADVDGWSWSDPKVLSLSSAMPVPPKLHYHHRYRPQVIICRYYCAKTASICRHSVQHRPRLQNRTQNGFAPMLHRMSTNRRSFGTILPTYYYLRPVAMMVMQYGGTGIADDNAVLATKASLMTMLF